MKRVALQALLCFVPLCLGAQTGVIHGTVRDSSGRPLPNALAQALGSSASSHTDGRGDYRLSVLRGTVILRVELIGFARRIDTVRLESDSLRHDVVLQRLPGILFDDLPRPPLTPIEDTALLSPVVVTGAKRSQLLESAFTTTVVMDAEQLTPRAVHTIDEAVDKAPGVQFLNGQVNIRGSTGYVQGLGSRVLLLVDGVPANQGDRGGINWDLVAVSDVERVEVVKGAGSALYGSAAFGGVINLITRAIQPGTHGRVRVTGGVFADPPHPEWTFREDQGLQQRVEGFASHGFGRVAAAVGGGYSHSDGYREQDARKRWNVGGKVRWASRDQLSTLDVSGAWTDDAYDVPLQWCTSGGCDTDGQTYQPFRVHSAGLGDHTVSRKGYAQAILRNMPSERLRWQARASWLRTNFTDYQRSGDDSSVSNRYGLEVRGEVHPPGERVVTTVGVEATHSDVSSDIFGSHTQGEYAAFGESELRAGTSRLTAGARIDFLATDGGGLTGVLSPRLGAVFTSRLGTTRVSVGHAFRAPTLAEKFVSTEVSGFTVVPNPGLQPETAWSFEVGHHARVGVVAGDAAVFWTEASGLIEPFIDQALVQIQFRNLTRARLAGLDLTGTVVPFRGLTTSLAYMFLSATELDQNGQGTEPLAFRPRHLLTLTADYAFGPATVGADFRFMSRMERVSLYEGDTRVPANVLDLRAGVTRGPLSGRLLLTNALNYIYNLVPRTLAPVRSLSLTLSWEY